MKANREAILTIYSQDARPVAFVVRDEASKKFIFYGAKELNLEELEALLNQKYDLKTKET